jgi:phenylpropionate dioxygenase-like ring-hydroxylating dioxygenase large terminal subunit
MEETMPRNLPYSTFPTGWYQVAWSDELATGDVRALTYFGGEQVLYRSDAGVLHLADAFCPHMGAHLGYGGTVEGNCIRCPYHGWAYDGDGVNVDIPYENRPNRLQTLVKWPVTESSGLVYAWYSAVGQPPSWQPPEVEELASAEYANPTGLRHMHERVRLQPQFMWENQVDAAHQQFVHKGSQPTDLYEYGDEGHVFLTKARILMGAGKAKTWATPNGPYWAEIRTWTYGLGFAMARFVGQDDSIHLQSVTPVDNEHCDLRATVMVRKADIDESGEPNELAAKRFSFEVKQTDRDIVIWEHQRYVQRAPFTPTEARPFNAFRRWSAQFYPDVDVPTEIPVPAGN